ncbi:MAG: PrsW family glutamic-type intramembrane protease [Phycisphaerae bacterium]
MEPTPTPTPPPTPPAAGPARPDYRRAGGIHDVDREPHLLVSRHACSAPPPEPLEPPVIPARHARHEDPLHSVWDEPQLDARALPHVPRDTSYADWLAERQQQTGWGRSWLAVLVLALAAGPWAVVGAFWGSGQSLFGVMTLVVFAPAVEEIMKTALLAWGVERKPYWFKSSLQLLFCGLASGLAFACIENLLYLHVYIKDPSPGIILWRWTVCVGLHVGCTGIATLGVVRVWRRTVRTRRRPIMSLAAPALVTAFILHGLYNLGVLLYG